MSSLKTVLQFIGILALWSLCIYFFTEGKGRYFPYVFIGITFLITVVIFWQSINSLSFLGKTSDLFSNIIGQFIANSLGKVFVFLNSNSIGETIDYRRILSLILALDIYHKQEHIFRKLGERHEYSDLELMSTIHYRCFDLDQGSKHLLLKDLPHNLSEIPLNDFWALLYKIISCRRLNPADKDAVINTYLNESGVFTIQDFDLKKYKLRNIISGEEITIPMDTVQPDLLKAIEFNKVKKLEETPHENVYQLVNREI